MLQFGLGYSTFNFGTLWSLSTWVLCSPSELSSSSDMGYLDSSDLGAFVFAVGRGNCVFVLL